MTSCIFLRIRGSSCSKVITTWYASPLVALRRAVNVAMHTAATWTTRGFADTLMQFGSLTESLCHLTDGDLATGDRERVARPND